MAFGIAIIALDTTHCRCANTISRDVARLTAVVAPDRGARGVFTRAAWGHTGEGRGRYSYGARRRLLNTKASFQAFDVANEFLPSPWEELLLP